MNKNLLDTLICPVSKAPLVYDKARQELLCAESCLAYPIRNGIPALMESEARRMEDHELDGSEMAPRD